MAEITRKRTGELLRKLFEILFEYPEGLKAGSALDKLASSVTLTDYEAGDYESSGRRFERIVRFATVDCVKAGWLIKHKGTWTVTDEGKQAHVRYKEPEAFYKEAVRLYRQWKNNQKGILTKDVPGEDSVEEVVQESSSITFEQAEEQAWLGVERFLKTMNPYDFQELVADLLEGMGHFVSWVSPPGKDGGVDIIAHPDPLGTKSPRLKVQVKRRADQKVDTKEVQSFISTITGDDAGLFVSTGGFTKDAEELARREHRKIMLVDLEVFFELWVHFYDELEDAARRRFPITPIHFFTPET